MGLVTIIGLLGKAGSGKSTAANYIIEKYGGRRFSFANTLKEIARDVFDFSEEQLYGTQEQKEEIDPRYNFSPRWLLQRLGTEGCRRHLGENVWVDATLRKIRLWQEELTGHGFAVIDDVRFISEAKALEQKHAIIIKLICPDAPTPVGASHASESEIDMIPEYSISETITSVRSPGSFDLKNKIESFMQRMGCR